MRNVLKRLPVAFLFYFCVVPMSAQPVLEPWNATPFSADPQRLLEAAAKVPAGESAVVVLLDEDRYSLDASGHSTAFRHLMYRVVAESGVQNWSSIDTLWVPWIQARPGIEARVISRDGVVHNFDAKALTDSPAPEESLDIFSDNRVLRAPLPAVAVGSIVEELITYEDRNPVYDAGTTGRFYFGRGVPVHQARLIIEGPSPLTVRLANHTSPVIEARKEKVGAMDRATFEATDLKPIEGVEWGLPYDTAGRAYIAFSTSAPWQELATRYSAIVDKQIANAPIQKLVHDALAGTKSRDEVVARLLALVEREVRYAGVEIGESSIVPRTPAEVLGHKYGDCKDKATLLVALLREAGLHAHVALLRAGDDLDVSPDLPGLGEFNHAIVVVDGDKPLWVDPTDEFSLPGALPPMDQGRMALIARTSSTSLTRTPAFESSTNHTLETRVFTMAEEGKSSIVETTEAHGAGDSFARRFYAQSDRKKYREGLEQYAKGYYSAKELKNVDAGDPHDLTRPFRLQLSISDSGRGITDEGEADVAIFPAGLLDSLPPPVRAGLEDDESDDAKSSRHHVRQNDFVFQAPYVKEWRYTIVPPPGYAARTLPQDETLTIASAKLTKKFSTSADGSIVADLTFDSGKSRLSATEFEDLRKALRSVVKGKAIVLGFEQIAQTKLAAGDVGGALREYQKLAALHPTEGRHHAEMARALLAGGMGTAAREEAQKAITLEPTYAGAYAAQGMVLEADVFGRQLRKGSDVKAAVVAYRKAKELDAKNLEYRAELAKLLEYSDDGELFGPGAHTEEAIQEYKAIKQDLKDERLEGELMLALAHAGHFAEMREAGKLLSDTQQRDLTRIVTAAALDGSAAALREAQAIDQNQRKSLLQSASSILLSLRLYPQAADLLDQAIQGASNKTTERAQVDVLRKAQKWESIPLPDSEPRSVVIRMLSQMMLKRSAHLADLAKYFPTGLGKLNGIQDDDGRYEILAGPMLAARARLEGNQVPMAVLVDLGLASMQFQQDGDESTGYRIRMRPAVASEGAPKGVSFFVTKEGDHYIIGGADLLPDLTGWSVLRLTDAGKVEAARSWLNWERETIQNGSGDDPLDGAPFARLWSKGKQSATLEEERVAAASLMLRKWYAPQARPILEAARDKATGERASAIDVALAGTWVSTEEWAPVEPIARRLVAANPDSVFAFENLTNALVENGKSKEAVALAQARLKALPKDRDALRAFARAASHDSDYGTAEKYYKQIIEELTPDFDDYNNRAWNALFVGKDLGRAVDDARQASTLSGGGPSALHTLAAVYAETGKSLEGREALLQSMDNAGRDEPADHDWYVLGRIAENYGATDAALAAYKRVGKPKIDQPESTWVLAQKRLEVMKKR